MGCLACKTSFGDIQDLHTRNFLAVSLLLVPRRRRFPHCRCCRCDHTLRAPVCSPVRTSGLLILVIWPSIRCAQGVFSFFSPFVVDLLLVYYCTRQWPISTLVSIFVAALGPRRPPLPLPSPFRRHQGGMEPVQQVRAIRYR